MVASSDALVVSAAAWVAAAAAGYLACTLVRIRRAGGALVVTGLVIAATAGGVASADSPHPDPPVGVSLRWTDPAPARSDQVTVRPGDCLWRITAQELRDPNAERIAERWPAWWRANRRVIGPDPNLIRPGEALHRPGPTPRRH